MRDQCVKVAPKDGIKIVPEEAYGPRDSDMTPQLTKIRNTAGVQAVVNPGFGQGPAIVTRNYRQLGITLPLYQSHGVASKEFIKLAGERPKACGCPAAALLIADKLSGQRSAEARGRELHARPTSRRPGSRSRPSAATPMTALMILVEAMKRAKSADQAKVRDEIEKTKGYHRHRRHREHVAGRPYGPRSVRLSTCWRSRSGDWTLVPGT